MAGLIRGIVRKKRKSLWQEEPRICGGIMIISFFAASHTIKSCEDGRKLSTGYNRIRAEGAVVVAVDYAVCHCPADSIAVARCNVGRVGEHTEVAAATISPFLMPAAAKAPAALSTSSRSMP